MGKPAAPTWSEDRWDEGCDDRGYLRIKYPAYPRASERGWALRSHVVWWLRTGQVVEKGYNIHHIDGNKRNDAFENLQLLSHSDHLSVRRSTEREYVCKRCGRTYMLRDALVRKRGGTRYCSDECVHAEPPHGTIARYFSPKWTCRCEECRAAALAYERLRHTEN